MSGKDDETATRAELERRITELERIVRDKDDLLARERRLREELEAGQRATERFLGVLSNELRIPVNAILGWARVLRRERLDWTGRGHAIATIDHNAHMQSALLEALLDISKISSGQLRVDIKSVDLHAVARAALEAIAPTAREKGIALELTSDGGDDRVLADPARIRLVVTNLLSNALRFTRTGGRIDVAMARDAGRVHLSVRDTGKGILPDALARIFDASGPASDSTATATMLGLYLVRRLVEIQGGTLHAESAGEGAGAVFTLALRRCGVFRARAPLSGAETDALADAQRLRGRRVLVVDDEVDTRDLLATLIRDHGAEVAIAEDVPSALGIFDRWRADVVVSDLVLPIHDGYELLRDLRARFGRLPVVAMSAFTSSGQAGEVLAAGFDYFAPKPLDIRRLVLGLEKLLP